MNKEQALKLTGEPYYFSPDETGMSFPNVDFCDFGSESATLDGSFTVDELKAIVWWMENKGDSHA